MPEVNGRSSVGPWSARALALAVLALPLIGTLKLALERFFQVDEFVFVRCAWLVSGDAVPYRDFFDHHTPLFYLLLSPTVGAAAEDFSGLLAARFFALTLLAALLFLVWRLAKRFGGWDGAWLATLLLVTFPPFVTRAIEIRPDLLATVAFLAAGWLILRDSRRPGVSAFLAGALTVAALLSTQKSLYYLWGLPLLGVLDLIGSWRGREREGLLRRPLAYAAGVAVPSVLFVLWLVWHDALAAFWQQNVVLAIKWQSIEDSFSATSFLREYVTGSPLWFVALIAGLIAAVRRVEGVIRLSRREVVVFAALAVPAVLSLVVNPIPWPYNFLPVFATLAPVTAALVQVLPARHLFWRRLLLTLVVLVALGQWSVWWALELRRSNGQQQRDLDRILAITTADQAVVDNNGGYVFRPAATWYWYHSSAMRDLMSEELSETMIDEILASRAPAWILDFRFRDLPENVRNFMLWHYKRFDRAIFLWGSAYRVEAGRGAAEVEFRAIDDGEYFIQIPEGQASGFDFRVGGRPTQVREPFRLEAGLHALSVERTDATKTEDFFVLWRPHTGELWQPLTGTPPKHYPYPF